MSFILKSGGKQYWAEKGCKLVLPKLSGEVGDFLNLDVVANVEDSKVNSNSKETVKVEIIKHVKDKKIIVFKKKRRQGYERKQGHRTWLTHVQIL